MLNERKDHLLAQKVEVALVFQQMLGTAEAHAYLTSNGFSEEAIDRVLYHPEARRGHANSEQNAVQHQAA